MHLIICRINFLENQIKDTYQLIEQDEIVKTMKLNHTSDEFCKQRIQEIVEDSLLMEKEIQIDKLNHINAYLKTELQKCEEDKQKIKLNIQDEITKYQQSSLDLESTLQKEVKLRTYYQEEYEKLNTTTQQIQHSTDEFIRKNEAQTNQHIQILQAELLAIKQENDAIRDKYYEFESQIFIKNKEIGEMKEDIDTFRKEYSKIEQNYSSVINEQASLAKALQVSNDSNKKFDAELRNLTEINHKLEDDFDIIQSDLQTALKEKNELISKTEYISSQVKKVI